MTKDPNQKPDLHEEALDNISKKVDEKLAQVMNGHYDEEMERKLAEIQELRRLEKEALATGRSEKRGRRKKHSAPAAPKEPAASAPALAEEQPADRVKEEAAPIEISEEVILTEDLRVAEAVDRFFDAAEELEREQEEKKKPDRKLDQRIDRVFAVVQAFFKKTCHLGKDLHIMRRELSETRHMTFEKSMAKYKTVWGSHLAPVGNRLSVVSDWLLLRAAHLRSWGREKRANLSVRLAVLGARAQVLAEKAYRRALVMLDYAEHHKLRFFAGFGAVVACAFVSILVVDSMTAYEYMYNGRVLGVVKDQQVVYKTVDVIGGKLAESLNANIEIDKEKDISFKKVIGWQLEIDSKDDVLNRLTFMKTLKAKGYTITVDGKQMAVLQSREAADEILDQITNLYAPRDQEGVEYESVGFAEDVKIEEIDVSLGNIQNTDEVMEYMLTGAVEKKVHLVQKGQTFNAIAKSYGMKPSELEETNPGIDPAKLKIDQELILTRDCPVLTVQTKEIATYVAEIPFDITYEETSAKYKGDKSVKSKGTNGQRQVVAEIVRNNGAEVSRKELSSKVLSNPVNQVVLVGTTERPKTVASGSFAYPVRGAKLSSKYGSRWGSTHQGIDLAVGRGTPIGAADGGTVSFAGYKGSYGNLVIINHGNGKETYYAHCSKLLVKRGDKVYKGQEIAKVGSTGNSTGPHCHFEVHVNGVPQNPLKYLNK